MPVYEYGCNECSHEFEEFKTMAEYDIPLSEPCPSCYKIGYISRLISGTRIVDPVVVGARNWLSRRLLAHLENRLNAIL